MGIGLGVGLALSAQEYTGISPSGCFMVIVTSDLAYVYLWSHTW
jgi:hypothetical protein